MALIKSFVSSTCYDLNIVRTQLRQFLINIGHEPVMSDYNDILFDPRLHTHESCVKEISNVDIVVLIIGSRFGGTAIPKAVTSIDIEFLKSLSKNTKLLEYTDKISITQLEILKAIESNIPIFTFIDSRVLHDHQLYEKNKEKGFIEQIDFPSIDNKDSAVYIFEFINFLRLRSKNNSVAEFSKLADIEDTLKKQWSFLFQRLLYEQRFQKSEARRIENISEELKDIKSLILSSITTDQARDVGRGVLKYRRLIEFLLSGRFNNIKSILSENISWDDLLSRLDIKEIIQFNSRKYGTNTFLVKSDGTFYISRPIPTILRKFRDEWEIFKNIETAVKSEIIAAIDENTPSSLILSPLRYKNKQIKEQLEELREMNGSEIEKSITTMNRALDKFIVSTEGAAAQEEEEEEEES